MNYDDFPILNEQNYNLINEQYNFQQPFERHNCIVKIYLSLNEIKYFFYELNNINFKIKSVLLNCKQNIQKLQDNLTATFTINTDTQKTIKSSNLFSLINKITLTSKLYKQWIENEEKEYYKKLALNSLEILLNSTSEILSVLEKSNVILFKYM